ncbi:MAG: hypothetical protein JO128_19600 [Alphaproteobacteria bacterium]|nr:hypothetical protein [Alphaproteobacteria bacterium]
MRNIIRFPTVRVDTPVRGGVRWQLTCRWVCNPATGRLEQRWTASDLPAETPRSADPADAAA